ncbi:MAG: transglutaminase family protein [Bacteroidota bacterium]
MKFKVFSELTYVATTPATFIFNIHAAKTANQQILEESFSVSPDIYYEIFSLGNNGIRFVKLELYVPLTFTITYQAQVEVSHEVINESTLSTPTSIMQLDPGVIPFLYPSRHCQSDKIYKLAQSEFGNAGTIFQQVNAINEWIYQHIEYLGGSTNSGTSAYDTLTQREGVCKDFAHLGIALCRALDIPARYFTGYAYDLNPPDFHACYEAYIGGRWIFFDATKLVPINGLVKIANSKDAAEAAVASFFGSAMCTFMNIQCEVMDENFVPYLLTPDTTEGIAYT